MIYLERIRVNVHFRYRVFGHPSLQNTQVHARLLSLLRSAALDRYIDMNSALCVSTLFDFGTVTTLTRHT